MPDSETKQPTLEDIPWVKTRQIMKELKDAGEALDEARSVLAGAEIRYDMAFQRFRTAYSYLLEEVVERKELGQEQLFNELVQQFPFLHAHIYTAMSLGKAIELVLKYEKADKPMSLGGIVYFLERGGFHFKTNSPSRECNAALLNLKSVVKDAAGNYRLKAAIEEEAIEEE